jgi:phosphate starvation-inducible protein PhoH
MSNRKIPQKEKPQVSKKKVKSPPFSLKKVEAKTTNQSLTIDSFNRDFNLVLHGVAGTGKTFLSMWLAFKEVLAGKHQRVIIVRSIVPSRDMGFLPGTAGEKMAVYETPYQRICSELFGRGDAYEVLKQKKLVEFITTSHLRGTTLDDAIIIVEEIQNMNFEEISTILTRVGNNCQIILCGDIDQSDLYRNKYDTSGLIKIFDILELMESVSFIEFGTEDIVRSGFVKEFLTAKHQLKMNMEDF